MINSSTKHSALVMVGLAVLLFVLAACGPAAPTPDTPTEEPALQPTSAETTDGEESEDDGIDEADEGYPPPAPTTAVVEGPYPPPTRPSPTEVTSYPDPEATAEGGIPFAFERPIRAGDTVLRGVGPAGLEVKIINVTFMGEEIASTFVDDDGRFEVEVPALEPGVRIGLTADIAGTGLEEEIIPGEGAVSVPQVGYYFDSVVISGEG